MKLFWITVPVLVAVAVAGCSDDKSTKSDSTSSAAASSSSTTPEPDEGPGGGVRIPLGETKIVVVPADAVMDIKVPVDWGQASAGLRCTVTDSTGRNEDLRSSDAKKQETIAGKEWTTLWTFAAAPNAELTVGCKDPDAKVSGEHQNPFIRVIPRGITPH
ncbi:hypothetical protein [Nocardia sp. NPDC052566]|uniref:hypothetical protein n=1 Tax=Nocardia sp. NPDC052566 TaxID=3364330 RepID=UPI0037C56A14